MTSARRLAAAVVVLTACSNTVVVGSFEAESIEVGDQGLNVWVADEPAERRRGLADIAELPDGIDGMLFSWPAPISASFTMRDTRFALDIWWIDAEGVLIGSAEMEPCPSGDCTNYRSPGPVLWALETPAGQAHFDVGDRLSTTEDP